MQKWQSDSMSRKLIWVGLGLVFCASAYLVIILGTWFYYSDSIYPGVTVAGMSLTGKSDAEAVEILKVEAESYLKSEEKTLGSYQIQFDYQASIDEAKRVVKSPFALGGSYNIPLKFTFDEPGLYKSLQKYDSKYRKSVQNPSIVGASSDLAVEPGQAGRRVLYGESVAQLQQHAGNLVTGYKPFAPNIDPNYTVADYNLRLDEIRDIAHDGLTLTYKSSKYEVSPTVVASWVQVPAQNNTLAPILSGKYLLAISEGNKVQGQGFDTAQIENYLSAIAKKIDRNPVDATLTMNGGKVGVFRLSRNGLALDLLASADNITKALAGKDGRAELVVAETEPKVTENSLADLGIKELISEGRSYFAGSPTNRRHNIRVGAAKFNGVLIKPGDTFSFTTNLGEVDASTGYLPELVIKDNETIPEYGGGLCQVSSTAFRAALNAGLPITARRPHSYPVTYYKPYGTDATVYVPNPDLKFNNDTGKYILIQTRIVGNYLYFDFYGTKKNVIVKFAGNSKATGAVKRAEDITPLIYGYGEQGRGSFTAKFWQFIYDANGKLLQTEDYVSKYDSPDKYPH